MATPEALLLGALGGLLLHLGALGLWSEVVAPGLKHPRERQSQEISTHARPSLHNCGRATCHTVFNALACFVLLEVLDMVSAMGAVYKQSILGAALQSSRLYSRPDSSQHRRSRL